MQMTHYMELIASNQPWNLIIFMAIPVILAETVAITELYILWTKNLSGKVRLVNKIAGIVGGAYFLCIALYLLFAAVVPLTLSEGWRGPADVIAVLAYVAGVVPLVGIALIDSGFVLKSRDEWDKMKFHAIWVAVFLFVAHIAMIFGMLNPAVLGYKDSQKPMMSTENNMDTMEH